MAVRVMIDAIDAHEADAIAPASTAESRVLRRIRLGPLLELEQPIPRTLGMTSGGDGSGPALSSPASEESTVSFDSTTSIQSISSSNTSTSSRASSTVARIVPHRFKRASSLLSMPLDALPADQLDLVKHQSEQGTMIGTFADAIAACVGPVFGRADEWRLRREYEQLEAFAPIDSSALQCVPSCRIVLTLKLPLPARPHRQGRLRRH